MKNFIKFLLSLFSTKPEKRGESVALYLVKEQPMKYEPKTLINLLDIKPKNNPFKMTKDLITPENIKKIFQQKNYVFFENDKKDYNVNIIGVRSADMTPNTFNDYICLMWKYQGNWTTKIYDATTDPGLYYLLNPMNVNGTAIMFPFQYRGAYILGLHNGYPALQQVKPMKYFRDNDRDGQFDLDSSKIYEEVAATNIHHAGNTNADQNVWNWSAGCNVIERIDDWKEFIDIVGKAKDIYGNSFTYTLINEKDFQTIV